MAQTTYYSRQDGNWNDVNTWSIISHAGAAAATIPGNEVDDIVLIGSNHTITYNDNTTIGNLTIDDDGANGVLRFPFTNSGGLNANFNLAVTGNVIVNSNGQLLSVEGGSGTPALPGVARNRTHTLRIGGNLTNVGTFDLQASTTNRIVNLAFNGATNQTISGEGIYDTYEVTYNNSGIGPDNRMINSSINFTNSIGGDRSAFTAGTYVHNNTATYTGEDNGGFTINTSIEILNGTFDMIVNPSQDRTGTINGDLTISGGRFNSGASGVGTGIIANLILNGTLTVGGTGLLNIGDGDGTATNRPTDGTLTVDGPGSTINGTSCYTHDVTLQAGTGLTVSNGATLSVGQTSGVGNGTGNFVLNGGPGNGASLVIDDAGTNFDMFGDVFDLNEDCTFTLNDGTVDIGENITAAPDLLELNQTGAQLIVNGGTFNILNATTTANARSIIFDAGNTGFTVTGGVVNIGNPTSGEGNVRFRAATGTFTFNVSGGVVNIQDNFEKNNVATVVNMTISNGATLNVGTGSGAGVTRSVIGSGTESTLTISDAGTTVTFGNYVLLGNVNLNDGLPFVAGNNTSVTGGSGVQGAFIASGASTVTFGSGLTISGTGSYTMNSGLLDIEPLITSASDTRFLIDGDLTLNGGTIEVGKSITSITAGNLIQLRDGGNVLINDGNFNVLSNAGLTSISNNNPFNLSNNGSGNEILTIGDGTGGASSATLSIAPNLAVQLPTPATRNILDVDGANAIVTLNSDGLLQVGGGNIGNFRLNTTGARFVMNGGTCNVTASFTVDSGTSATISGGTFNVGTTDSNGNNRFIYATNPAAVTQVSISGGTVNIGDGNSIFDIGNDNTNPAFGSLNFSALEISGTGVLNLNGGFRLRDANARFLMSGGAFNINPLGSQNLLGTNHIFYLERGIVDFTGGIITIVNPNANAGGGQALRISPQGNPSSGDFLSGIDAFPSPVDFSGSTFRFGNGTAAETGSSEGFDVNIDDSHTYGTFTVNNPSGDNRFVEIVNSGNSYQISGDLTVAAGILDINTNTINRDAEGGTFTLGASGQLTIGNTNGLNHFPGSNTAFTNYSLDINSIVEYDGAGNAAVDIPGTAQFGFLTISGTGTKTLSAAESVRSTLTLSGGTFVTGTNLTMTSGSKILRTNTDASGIMTGAVQGTDDYTIEYIGNDKTTQTPEWSGLGNQSLIVNLTNGQTLTQHTDLIAEGDVTIASGVLADGGNTLTVNGNVSNSSTHTGTGKILVTGGVSVHSIGGDGTGIFENLELDDATNNALFTADQTVNGVLTLTNGILNIDTYVLNIGAAGSVSVSSPDQNKMIRVEGSVAAGGVSKAYAGTGAFTWPVGVSGKYTPATINVTSTGTGGIITVKPVNGANPFTSDAALLELNYYWSVSNTGFSDVTATHTYTYVDSDVQGNEAGYIPARYVPVTWTSISDISLVNTITNAISFPAVNYLNGDFTAGEPSEFGVVLTYYSTNTGGTSNWDLASSWSTSAINGPVASTIPGSNRPVFIGGGNTIIANVGNLGAASLELQADGTLEIADGTTGHNFGTVVGSGILRIMSNSTTSPEFPGGSYTDFLGSSGGTVDYSGSGTYTLPSTPAAFHNLSISGSGGFKIFPDADFNLTGNLTIAGSATALISGTVAGNLSVGGNIDVSSATATLRLPDGTARSIDVSGNLSNEGTIDVIPAGTTLHHLNIGGNFTNNNTFDLNTAGSDADVTFTGATNATLSGSGATTDFNRLIVNKGTSQPPELEVTSTNFTLSAPANGTSKALEIQNGTFKLSSAHTITLSTGGVDYSLPATGRLWVNDAGAQVEITSASNSLLLAGTLQISDGAIHIGDDATGLQDNDIVYITGNPAIAVDGGTLTVGGAIRGNPTTTAIDYSQSGGTVIVSNNKSLTGNSGVLGDFAITNAGSSFTMSNGTIRIMRNNATGSGTGFRIINGVTHNVTGGTVEIITNSTVTNRQIQVTSGAPFWNLNIGNGSGNSDVGAARNGELDFVVLNDFTMNTDADFKLFRANGGNPTQDDVDMSVRGNFTITNGTFLTGAPSTTTFNGISGTQIITGSATFHHLEINNTGTSVQLASGTDLTVEGNWTTTAGIFDAATNSRQVTFNGTVAQTLAGQPVSFYDLELNNANGLTVTSSATEVTNQLTLSGGILDIGSNSLLLTNTASTAIQGTPSATTMVQTDGSNSASGITKSFPALNNETFVFPLGTGGGYRPVTLTVTTGNAATGTINVIPVASQHPSAPTNSLDYYWLISTSGFGGNPSITHNYQYLEVTDLNNGSEANYLDASFDGTTWTEGNTGNVDDPNDQINVTSTGALSGQAYTAGESPFSNPLIYYSRNATGGGDWSATGTWSTTGHGGADAGSIPGSTNPVIIANTHTVTIQDGTVAQSASTQIDAGGTIDAVEEDISQLGTVQGTGILKLSPATAITPVLPSLDAVFVASGGGTIEYGSGNNYNVPVQATYNNLTISGSGTKTLTNNISVIGNLAMSGGSFDLNAFTANRTTNGGTFSMLAGTTLRTGDGDNFPANYATYTLDVGSTVHYDGRDDTEVISGLNGAPYGNLTLSRGNGVNAGGESTKTLGSNIGVNGNLTINQRVQLEATTFNISLAGNWYRDARNNSAFVPGTGTVTFDGTTLQNIQVDRQTEPEEFYNLVVNNAAGVRTFDNINQLTVDNHLTLTSGILNLNSDPLLIGGDLSNNTGNADAITNQGTVTFNNLTGNQSLTGATNFNNLTIAKASGLTLTLNDAVTVTGILNMQNDGNIVLTGSGHDLTIGTAGSISGTFSADRMIVTGGTTTGSALIKNGTSTAGSFDFTYPIGVGTSYTPAVIDAATVNAGGSMTVRSVTGANSNLSGDASKALNRYFLVNLLGGLNNITATFDFTYADADVQGTEVSYIARYWDGSNWIQPGNDFVLPASNRFGSNLGGTNVTVTMTEWIAGEPGAIFPKLYSVNSGDWSTLANWNSQPDGSGSTPASPPNADNEVEIQAAHTITISGNTQSASDLTINGTLDLGTTTGHTFGPVDGTGTLRLASGTFPAYTTLGTTFFDAGQGTVEYYNGAGPYALPSSPLIYNNLTISGGDTKTLGAITTVLGDLTIDASTLDADNVQNYSLTLGGNLNTPNSGTLIPRQGTFTLNGAATQTLPSLTFFNLAFDNTGSKTINSSITVNNFTIQSASGIVNAGANNIDVSGNWSNSAGSSGFSNTGTVTFNNTTTAQSMAGTTVFGILTVDKTAQTLNIVGNNNETTGDFNITGGNVALGSNNFTVGGDFNNGSGTGFTSSSPSTVTFNGTFAQNVSNPVTFQSLTIDGSDPFTFTSSITVNENVTVNSGTLTATSGSLDLSGGITVESGATFNASNIDPISLEGDFIDNGGTTTLASAGTVTFDGTAAQALTGSIAFNNLTKNGAGDLTLSGNSTLSGTLTLTSGDIISTPTGFFTLDATGASISGGGNTSHINGVLAYTVPDNNTYNNLVYPLGDGTNYRPLTLSVTQTGTPTSRTYTTQIFSGPPTTRTLTGGLTNVSSIRYYNITQSSPAAVASATVRIDYGVDDDVSTDAPDLGDLRIAKSDGSGNWVSIGGFGSATPAGFITSNAFTTFSDFVLASENFSNTLPVELLNFTARLENNQVVLDWTTASEINNDFFEVQRSENGENWEVIGKKDGNGTSNETINYSFVDKNPFFGQSFYRLRQVDFDGQFEYSNVVSVKNEFTGKTIEALIFPNPTLQGEINLKVLTANKENKISIKIINMAGEIFYRKIHDPEYFAVERPLEIHQKMGSGIYIMIIEQNGQAFKKKIIIL